MAGLRVALNENRPRLIAYLGEARSTPHRTPPRQPNDNWAADEGNRGGRPIVEQRASPAPFSQQQSVTPTFAARTYQANIPTRLYTYPIVTHSEVEYEEASSNASGDELPPPHAIPVTLVPYEPGSLVDYYV